MSATTSGGSSGKTQATGMHVSDTVDLTASDSDEDEIPLSKRSATFGFTNSSALGYNNDIIIALDTRSSPSSPEHSADDAITLTTDDKVKQKVMWIVLRQVLRNNRNARMSLSIQLLLRLLFLVQKSRHHNKHTRKIG